MKDVKELLRDVCKDAWYWFPPESTLSFIFSFLFSLLFFYSLCYSSSSFSLFIISLLFFPIFPLPFLLYFLPSFSLFFLSFPFFIHPLLISPPYSLQHSSSLSFKLMLLFLDFSKSAFVRRSHYRNSSVPWVSDRDFPQL